LQSDRNWIYSNPEVQEAFESFLVEAFQDSSPRGNNGYRSEPGLFCRSLRCRVPWSHHSPRQFTITKVYKFAALRTVAATEELHRYAVASALEKTRDRFPKGPRRTKRLR
jgi:hypothetical protein